MIKLAVFDLDHTLLKDDKRLDEKTIESVRALKAAGVEVVLATGRKYEMARPYADLIGLDGLIVCTNGSYIVNLKDETVIEQTLVDKKGQAHAIDYAKANDLVVVVYSPDAIHTTSQERIDVYKQWNHHVPSSPIELKLCEDYEALKTLDAFKVLIILEGDDNFNRARKHFSAFEMIHATQSSIDFLDIIPASVNKGRALDIVMDHYGVDPSETLAFGDSDNDAEMLRKAGYSYAMVNGTDPAKKAAKHITAKSNDEAGVSEIIDTVFLPKLH